MIWMRQVSETIHRSGGLVWQAYANAARHDPRLGPGARLIGRIARARNHQLRIVVSRIRAAQLFDSMSHPRL